MRDVDAPAQCAWRVSCTAPGARLNRSIRQRDTSSTHQFRERTLRIGEFFEDGEMVVALELDSNRPGKPAVLACRSRIQRTVVATPGVPRRRT